MANMKKVTVSGTYRKHDGDVEDYTVSGYVPDVGEDRTLGAVQNRYIEHWLKEAKISGVKNVRQTYIESIEDSDKPLSIIGKEIRELNAMEIQDFAVVNDLMEIPANKAISLKTLQARAIIAYERKQGNIYPIDTQLKDLPEVFVDGEIVKEEVIEITLEDQIAFDRIMQDIDAGRAKIFDLRSMCKKLGIKCSPKDGTAVLVEKIKQSYQ